MKNLLIIKIWIIPLVAIFVFCCMVNSFAEDANQDLLKQTEDLKKALEEMKKAMEQLNTQNPMGMTSNLPKTPEEKVALVIENTNRGYRDIMASLSRIEPKEGLVIPVTLATKIKGYIIVSGKDYDVPSNGWRRFELEYKVKEEFIGYLLITDYYDTKARKFTGKKTYMIGSASTGIDVKSQKGKQCVKTDYYLPPSCIDWRDITEYDVDKGDVYPAIHDWVIMTDSSDEKKVVIKVESPSIYFRSSDKQAGRALGCFGTKFERTTKEFEEDLELHILNVDKNVGYTFSGSPKCDIGSKIELNIELCDPKLFATLDKCKQVEMLLEDVKMLIEIRDSFKDMAPGAKNIDHLLDLVTLDIQTSYPGVDLKDEAYLDKSGGSYNICTGEKKVPDFCKGCIPRPWCEWKKKGLEVHEDTHDNDITNDPETKRLFCDTQYQYQKFSDINDLDRALAKAYAELDYNAYNEQAKYLRDIIQEQLDGNVDCTFKPEFFSEFENVISSLDKK